MSKDMERLTEALEEHAITTNDFDVVVAESIAEGVLESTWLAERDAKVRAEELREFATGIPSDIHDPRHIADVARIRADRIEKEAGL
ncbi:MAG: hypothetical protein ACTH4Y_08225 [Microbacterium gubbeenense]|uniref:hypothetical protein n=1 Tax=Microbacterium gubbeenense TaxID=159896 RepID=UPI003F97549A